MSLLSHVLYGTTLMALHIPQNCLHLPDIINFNKTPPVFVFFVAAVRAEDEVDVDGTVEEDLGKSRDGSRTDDEVVQRWVSL